MNENRFKRLLLEAMLLPVAVLLVLSGILVWQIHILSGVVAYQDRVENVIAGASRLERLVIDQETGLRGYEITDDARFLDPYHAAEPLIPKSFDDLRPMILLEEQRARLDRMRLAYASWQGFAQQVLAVRAGGGSADDLELNLEGKRRMDQFRAEAEVFQESAHHQLTLRTHSVQMQMERTVTTTLILAAVSGLLLAWFERSRLNAVSSAYAGSLSELRQRADEIFRNKQWLETTLQSIGDAVIACDVEGRVQLMNPVAQEITGWKLDEARGVALEKVFNIVNEQTRAVVENPVDKVRRLNRVVGLANHTILIRKDKTELNIDDSGAPIRNSDGEMIGVVLVFRDITLQYKTQHALLANEKLAAAGRLSATIAHEIHNPLDSVANLLYLLQTSPTPEEAERYLTLAQQELNRVTQISRTMLSLYREAKAPVPVDLKDLLESVLVLLDRQLQDRGVQVEQEMAAPVRVEGYPAELRQVFMNLIANAADAAGPGGRTRVRLKRMEVGNLSGAIVEVIDNGAGIPPEIQSKLFQPFFTTKGERGTGLGLWVSRGIVQRHGGRITVDSRVQTNEPAERMSEANGSGNGSANAALEEAVPDEHGTVIRVFLPERFNPA